MRNTTLLHALYFLVLPLLILSLWGCAATDQVQPLATLEENTPLQEEICPSLPITEEEIHVDEVTVPEPEITVAEEIEELENLGAWEEGTPEAIPVKPEVTYDFPVTMNKQVEFYLNFFQHKHRTSFVRWLERSGRYLPMIQEELRKAGLPEDLAYLPMIESGYSLTAYSRARAAGPWQFISSTGRNYGLAINNYVDERRDPVKSTKAAIAFLSDLYDMFGDWQLAVAAYNAGGRKISRGLKLYKATNFWELAQHRYLKNETKRYVPKLIAAIIIAKNPEKYGFAEIQYQQPLAYETVNVPRWTSLRAVEVACKTDLEQLRDLNRQLRKLITPPDQETYTLKVPVGQKEIVAQNLPNVRTTVSTEYKTHIVAQNDTLTKICNRYNLNKTTLLKANNLRKSKLTQGQRLRIPYQTTNYALWNNKEATLAAADDGKSHLVLHKILPGETVSLIARRYNVPLHLVAAWNDLKDINCIRAGQQLALYVTDTAGTANIVTAEIPAVKKTIASRPEYYKVKSGDNLWTIARRFDVKSTQLKQWNNLKNNLIHPGTRLRITAPDTLSSLSAPPTKKATL